MTDLTPEALDAIEARANAATEGLWWFDNSTGQNEIWYDTETGTNMLFGDAGGDYQGPSDNDAALICLARMYLPYLVAEIRGLRAENEDADYDTTMYDALPLWARKEIASLKRSRDALQTRIDDAIAVENSNLDTAFYVIVGKMIAILNGKASNE